jgi:hypothetical protein
MSPNLCNVSVICKSVVIENLLNTSLSGSLPALLPHLIGLTSLFDFLWNMSLDKRHYLVKEHKAVTYNDKTGTGNLEAKTLTYLEDFVHFF